MYADHALATAAADGEFAEPGALAVAVFGRCKDRTVRGDDQRDQLVPGRQPDAPDTRRQPAHWPDVFLVEANGFTRTRIQQDILAAIGDRHADQVIAVSQVEGDDAIGARSGKRAERRFLYGTVAGCHEDKSIFGKFLDRQNGIDPLIRRQRQQVDNGFAPRALAGLWQAVDFEPVKFPPAGKTQQSIVGVGDEKMVDEILPLDLGRRAPTPTAFLGLVGRQRLCLCIAAVRESYDDVFLLYQVLDGQVAVVFEDFRTPGIGILLGYRPELIADHFQQPVRVGKYLSKTFN